MLPELTPALWGGAGAIFAAGILRGFTGFGFALAAVPLASLFLPPRLVVACVLIMQTAIGLRDCVRELPRGDRGVVGWLAFGALFGTPFGVAALALLPQPVIRLALGAIVGIAVLASWQQQPSERAGSPRLALAAGVISGVCNGLAAMAGPAAIVYFLTFEKRVVVMRSSLMAYFPIASAAALPFAWYSGLLTMETVVLAACGMPLMVVGGWLGAFWFRRLGGGAYRRIALGALCFTALASILRGIAALA